MSELDLAFSQKARAFSQGDLAGVLATLSDFSQVTVGFRTYSFAKCTDAAPLLKTYRENLAKAGYSHTNAIVLHKEMLSHDRAHVLAEYAQCDLAGEPIDTLMASYFMTKYRDGQWRNNLVEFVETPLGFQD